MRDQKLLSNEEIASFCSQTAMLFQAGITPVESMGILAEDVPDGPGKELIASILEVCMTGEPFWQALKSTKVFPDYCIHMLMLGEESGNLDVCMSNLAEYYEKQESISDGIKSAVAYPLLMIAMMAVVIFVLIGKVMPVFEQVYAELGSELTGFSASLLTIGNHLNQYSVVFLVIALLLVCIYLFATKTQHGKRAASHFLDVFAPTKHFHETIARQRFANGMAMALASGMDTYSSLDMVSRLVDNKPMQERIAQCKAAIEQGESFPEALSDAEIFNHLHSKMVGVGFHSGNIDSVLRKIAEEYEKETDRRIQSMLSVLEPTLVIILSVIVGMILLSVILPLMGIMTSIG